MSGRAFDHRRVQEACREILEELDPDPAREGLRETPARMAKAYEELTAGYGADPARLLKTFDSNGYDEMVLQTDIPFQSLCEHHLLPFVGRAHVGYVPDGRIVGLSKLARLVEIYARRLQVQERLTAQIADALMEHLHPLGAICVVEAEHLCMTMRGIRKAGSRTTTSAVRGLFLEDEKARAEAFALMGL